MGWIFDLKASVTHSLPIYVSSVGLKLSEFGIELPQIMELYNVTASLIAKAYSPNLSCGKCRSWKPEYVICPKLQLRVNGFRGLLPDSWTRDF